LKRHAPSSIEKKNKFRIKSSGKNINNQSIFSSGSSPHETFILNLLKKPFKNPLPNFVSSKTTKSLGIRRLQAKIALHDPNQENALVLYRPKKENVLKKKQEIIADVAVVVDPRLSDILRPHQKEGVRFMYDSITGIYDSDTLKITYFC
ncbi:MAG: DNA repair and recombination protein RAD54-like, partial [Marteilia pararefringens]